MNDAEISVYRMNPAEDEIRFGDELAEGMWVLPEDPDARYRGKSEDDQIRGQRFRRVTRLRRQPGYNGAASLLVFIGEWVDGYQEVYKCPVTTEWLVKKDPIEPGDEVIE